MNKKVKETIKKHSLIANGDKILVGLSGGADSMCLVHVLCSLATELGISVAAAHVNHNIRGDEADADAECSRIFAQRLGIDFHMKSADVKGYALNNGISDELAGREIRYAFFRHLQEEHGYTKIATAHNKNDNAETLMMNFMRGATIHGLCGIPIKRDDIIRPLLEISRTEIEDYCEKNSLSYVTDKTNFETLYTRNKIRLNLIPEIESEFNSNFINTVTKNAQIMSSENDYIDNQTMRLYAEFVSDGTVSLDFIKVSHPAIVRRLIMKMLFAEMGSVTDVSSVAVQDIIRLCENGESGKSINLPGMIVAEIEYGKLVISAQKDNIDEFEYILRKDTDVFIPELNAYARLEECDKKTNDGSIYFSADTFENIHLRNRRFGDIFRPEGMSGNKKLKNLFIDCKIPRSKRAVVPIITVNGSIASVGTLRCSKDFGFWKKNISLKVILIKQEEKSIGTKTI